MLPEAVLKFFVVGLGVVWMLGAMFSELFLDFIPFVALYLLLAVVGLAALMSALPVALFGAHRDRRSVGVHGVAPAQGHM
jgi:uncharacterized membrane protein